ncbi:HD domain-containing protein 1 [Elsinoe fawcettii]|nr:HD domain-containing protein 1 [Elsinoe fawcettii]
MAVMVLMTPNISTETKSRALQMSVVHDLAEAITGDIAPADGMKEKHVREELACEYLSILSGQPMGNSMSDIWREYEEGQSEAARLVHSIDALECMDQALIYERQSHKSKDLSDFMDLSRKVVHESVIPWQHHLTTERHALWSGLASSCPTIFVIA